MTTINGSTSSSNWTYKLEVEETSTNIENNTSQVRVRGYLGRPSGNGGYGYAGNYKYTVQIDDSDDLKRTKNKYQSESAIAGGRWSSQALFDETFTIKHNSDGQKTIKVYGSMSTSEFSPSSASATGNVVLSQLHKAPDITTVSLTETNTQLTSLGVANNTIVQYLSNKTATINVSTYDNATITNYSVYHNNILIGSSTSNSMTINFANIGELIDSGIGKVGLMVAVTDSLGGYNTKMFDFSVIKYTRPTIEKTSTTIKRKTGNGTVLTDNKVLLNFVGTCYKGNDVIGNANVPTVQYKIWNTTEPNYSTITTPNSANVSIKDYEISNILYTSTYNYKIKIYDVFTITETTINLKTDKVPTGVSVWTEYKDRVDFEKVTIKGKDISPSLNKELNIASAWLETNKLITMTAWESYYINLDDAVIIGDKLTLENGYIKIGAGVKKVRICGSVYFGAETPNTEIRSWFTTYDVSGNAIYGVPSFGRKAYSTNVILNIPTRILDVEEGYTIRLTAQIGTNGDVSLINRSTTLNVEVIE